MVIRRGCWPAPRSSGMLYLVCKRAKPVRRSSSIVVYIDIYRGYGYIIIEKNSTAPGVSGQLETPPPLATVPKLSVAYCMRIIMYAHV